VAEAERAVEPGPSPVPEDAGMLAAALEPLLSDEETTGPSRDTRFALERADAVQAAEAPWERMARDLEDIARSSRGRDVLLARAARVLTAFEANARERRVLEGAVRVEARPAEPPAPAPARSRGASVLLLVLAFVAWASVVAAKLSADELERARDHALRAEERAARLEAELSSARGAEREAQREELSVSRERLAQVAETLAALTSSGETASISSSATTLPAGLGR
jgi:hypothetical protein